LIQGRDFKGRWGTFQVDTQTGVLSTLFLHERTDLLYPSYSPNGKSLYFSRKISASNEFALIQHDLASGMERELIRRAFLAPDKISPDGRYLAISAVDVPSGARVKLLVPTDGGEPRELMRVTAGVAPGDLISYNKGIALMGTQWAPDGRSFLTLKRFNDEKRSNEVWRVSLDGGAPSKTDLELHGLPLLAQVHPDGTRVAFTVAEKGWPKGQEVWVLENFLPTTTSASK
jgi:Tol biopolymer transport system component